MISDVTTWFAVGAVGMTVGTILFVWGGVTRNRSSRKYYATLAAISGIAAVAYLVMALEIGWHDVGDRTIFIPRYIDWLLTTPLLLLYLTMLVDASRNLVAKIMAVNILVIVAGFVAALMTGIGRFALFGVGGLAFVVLGYLLLVPLTRKARDQQTESLFRGLRNLTVILWAVYPAIWLFGTSGLDLLTMLTEVLLVTYLDLVTKVGFGLIALNASAVLTEEFSEKPEPSPSMDD